MRRTVIALILIATSFAFAATASAQSYGTTSVSGSDTTPAPGQTITVSGTGCPPNSQVNFLFDGSPAGGTTSGADGSYSGEVTVPSDASSGTHQITVECGAVVMGLEITVSPAASGAAIPRTGSSSTIPMTSVGLGLLAVGGLFVVAARRRRAHSLA